MVTKQLLQAPSATDMVATDVRTPPRVKHHHKGEEYTKGEVIPVIMDEPDMVVSSTSRPRGTTPTSGGLSTWILLSNGEQSTLAASTRKKLSTQPTEDPVKIKISSTTPTPPIQPITTDKIIKAKPNSAKPAHKKHNTTKEDSPNKSTITLQDPKFKNRTPVIVGKIPTTTPKNKVNSTTTTTTKKASVSSSNSTTAQVNIIKRKPTVSITRVKNPGSLPDIVPTTSLLLETGTVEQKDTSSTTTTEQPSSTTKRTRRPSTKKKKNKTKNRRRRPANKNDGAQSKIEDNEVASTKIENIYTRPLSTRIYNYLSREVMPNVGVGLVGLVLTAGLAGLLLYPFGGGIARRNYEKVSSPSHDNHMYYYSDYNPISEDQTSNTGEESVFGQVLSGLNNNAYSSPYESNKYANNNHKYRYDDQYMNSNVNGYAGIKDYSTLPDSVKTPEYSAPEYKSPEYKAPEYKAPEYKAPEYKAPEYKAPEYKAPEYKAPEYKTAEYSPLKDYSTLPDSVKAADYKTPEYSHLKDYSTLPDSVKGSDYSTLPDSTKYYNMEPMSLSPQYKSEHNSYTLEDTKYPSLTEYTAYTSADSVGTGGTYDKTMTDNSDKAEDKSDKSQPQFSALVGSPHFSNSDFVGSVSVSGSYGTEVVHKTGALPMDHGPRSLKLDKTEDKTEKKSRKRRDVHDDNDFANEIDDSEEGVVKQIVPSTSSPVSTQSNDKDTTTSQDASTTVREDPTTTPSTVESNEITTPKNEPTDHSISTTTESDQTTLKSVSNFDTDREELTTPKDTDNQIETEPQDFGFFNVLRNIVQLKLRIGLSLLRSTSEAFQRYINRVTQRMEVAVKSFGNSRSSSNNLWTGVSNLSRSKRDVSKSKKRKPIKKYKRI